MLLYGELIREKKEQKKEEQLRGYFSSSGKI